MLCVSWNVNGLRAVAQKGFVDSVAAMAPDVLLLQETKARDEDLPEDLRAIDGYVLRMHPAERRGYSGVAIYARREPDEWICGLGDPVFDCEGRVLAARFDDLVVISIYFPNSRAKGERIDYRLAFGAKLRRFLAGLRRKGRHVVIGGDFNVAHQPVDIARPKQNEGNPGYLPDERAWMTRFLKSGYVDTFRRAHPDATEAYSWWSFRFNARQKNIGWRLDYLCVDVGLWDRVRSAEILADVVGSDHCPVAVDIADEH